MTIQQNTVCSLIQTFPVLLILAQKQNKCLETPFVYKPPSPTHSPEYYEALDTLFNTFYHGQSHGHDFGHTPCGSKKYKPCYPQGHSYGYTPPYSYSYVPSSYGSPSYSPGHYGTYGSSHYAYPTFKKSNLYAMNGDLSNYGYAGGQYNVSNRYEVVVKKTKISNKGSKKRKSRRGRGAPPSTNTAALISPCNGGCLPWVCTWGNQEAPTPLETRIFIEQPPKTTI